MRYEKIDVGLVLMTLKYRGQLQALRLIERLDDVTEANGLLRADDDCRPARNYSSPFNVTRSSLRQGCP